MQITYYGHACFLLESATGFRAVLDPYEKPAGGGLGFNYPPLDLEADLVTVSHEHFDHGAARLIRGNPRVLREPGSYSEGGLRILGITAEHDPEGGRLRGRDVIFRFEIDGVRLAHFGDFGQRGLRAEQARELAELDLLLLPVGGTYTLDAPAAAALVEELRPQVVIPMHYRTPYVDFLAPVDGFLARFPAERIRHAPTATILFTPTDYEPGTVLVLPYAAGGTQA